MNWRVEIKNKDGVFDSFGESIHKSIQELGLSAVKNVGVTRVYNLSGEISQKQAQKVCDELLVDPVTQTSSLKQASSAASSKSSENQTVVEIAFNPGVMDPVEASTVKGIRDLGISEIDRVSRSHVYTLKGKLKKSDKDTIVNKVLSNKIIQHEVRPVKKKKSKSTTKDKELKVIVVDILGASDKQLKELSEKGQLFLNLDEMHAIKKHYKKIGRNPTDCELETIAQTWSEHCYHKTFRGNIQYTEGKKKRIIKNLLKSTIVKATQKLNKPWCVSVFHDNAGVIKFDKESHVCFKVETHNHPSALEPFGGANTGIGGVIRDILGTGLGAKPICSTDVFCFAPPDMPFEKLPPGTLHPKRIMKGVVSGVRDYGNKMGIPTVNGSICFDERYVGNPLVYCGNVGIMPVDKVKKKVNKGDLIVTVGGRTGRDGIHGATFSSGELTTESEEVSSGAVQIGDPIQEKKVQDALLQARDKNLYSAITDCGAGGFSSAVGEMGEHVGAKVELDLAPLKYDGLTYEEIWISESQERMVLSVPPDCIDELLEVFAVENVEATVIGKFTGTKRLELFFNDCQVCDLDMKFLHEGNPKITKKAVWKSPKIKKTALPKNIDLGEKLRDVLGHYNVCSKEWVVRQYDHEVQGGSIVKPFVGAQCDGPSDASVVAPKLGSNKGLAISNGINPRYGLIDPFWMAGACIDEAVRQIVSVGGNLDRIAILDNFCWGNPDKPDRLGGLVRASEGCYKFAVDYQVPFISGKDSLYNEYADKNKSIAIPGTLLISAIGLVDDVTKAITMDFKDEDNLIYVVGTTYDEMGGSVFYDTYGELGRDVPKTNSKAAMKSFKALSKAISKRLVRAVHDCSDGGLGVALAEMSFSGEVGINVDLNNVPYKGKKKSNEILLFSESQSRFVVEVSPKNQKKFESEMKGNVIGLIGKTQGQHRFIVNGLKKNEGINTHIEKLKEAWQKPLRW